VAVLGMVATLIVFYLTGHGTQISALKDSLDQVRERESVDIKTLVDQRGADLKLLAEQRMADQKATADQFAKAQYEKGQTDAFVKMAEDRIAAVDVRFKELDDKLQREQILLAESGDARIKALDEKLQMEYTSIKRLLEQQVANHQEQILDLRDWRLKHVAEVAEQGARLTANQTMGLANVKELEERFYLHLIEKLRDYRLQLHSGRSGPAAGGIDNGHLLQSNPKSKP
jgi:hypothetical protein